jgi:hypothetical protein
MTNLQNDWFLYLSLLVFIEREFQMSTVVNYIQQYDVWVMYKKKVWVRCGYTFCFLLQIIMMLIESQQFSNNSYN